MMSAAVHVLFPLAWTSVGVACSWFLLADHWNGLLTKALLRSFTSFKVGPTLHAAANHQQLTLRDVPLHDTKKWEAGCGVRSTAAA